jgi:signal peptidase I
MMLTATPARDEVLLDLAAEFSRRFGQVQVVGRSMIPTIYPDDVLTIELVHDAQYGDVVLYVRDGRFCVHRVTRKWQERGKTIFVTQGDALAKEDLPFEDSQLLGRVTSVARFGRPVSFAQTGRPLMTLLRWAVRRSGTVASSLLRRHSLRTRLLRGSRGEVENRGQNLLEGV